MRTDQEMMELIQGTAMDEPRIRAVVLNGSRAVPSAPRDEYQDYDIVYFVSDFGYFVDNPAWIDRFGERIMLEHVAPPEKKAFEDTCNSFWWVLQNAAKGIARRELPYAVRMLGFARDSLDHVVVWHIGMENGFRASPGKMGKYFENYLADTRWRQYVSTYPAGDYESLWRSLFAACGLFRDMAMEIAGKFAYEYPVRDDERMTDYLQRIRISVQER